MQKITFTNFQKMRHSQINLEVLNSVFFQYLKMIALLDINTCYYLSLLDKTETKAVYNSEG